PLTIELIKDPQANGLNSGLAKRWLMVLLDMLMCRCIELNVWISPALRGTTGQSAARASGERLFRIRDILSSLTSTDINAMLNSSILAQGTGIIAGSSITSL